MLKWTKKEKKKKHGNVIWMKDGAVLIRYNLKYLTSDNLQI